MTYDGQRHGFFNKEPYRTRTLEAAVAFLRRHGYLPKAAQAPPPH